MQRQGKILAIVIVAMVALLTLWASKLGNEKKNTNTERSTFTEEDAALRYPYMTLNEKERELYETLYDAMTAHAMTVELPHTYTEGEYERVYLMVRMQEPQFFYVSTLYQLSENMSDTMIQYDIDEDGSEEMTRELNEAADEILDGIPSDASEWETVLYIHDEIVKRCTYIDGANSSTAYGCLVDGMALCEGYAKAFTYLTRRMGMDVMCIPGEQSDGENHVWNIVKADGAYYNVDVTWDDNSDLRGAVSHRYLTLPDERFGKHYADSRMFIPPACTTNNLQYYQERGLVLGEYTQAKGSVGAWAAMHEDTDRMIEFYCSSPVTYSQIIDDLENGSELISAIAPYSDGQGQFFKEPESQIITIIF